MSYQPPNGYDPSNRELQAAIIEVKGLLTQVKPTVESLNQKMDRVMRAMYGDKDDQTKGVLTRLGDVENIVEGLQTRNLVTDTRTKTLVAIAGFLGITNVAGILAVIGYLSGVIHR